MRRMQRRLGKLENVSRAVVPPRSGWDLACLDDDELEALAGKAEEANRAGRAVTWTADEEAVLTRLSAKVHVDSTATAKVRT